MSDPQHPASPPSSYPPPMFQRIRPPGGHPATHRGQAPWILRALYGATSFGLLAGAADPAYGGQHVRQFGPADTTVQATNGNPEGLARVQGPIVTRHDREHGIQALEAGAAVVSGSVTTHGDDAYALYYGGGARVVMTDVHLLTRGARAHAVEGMRGVPPEAPGQKPPPEGTLEVHRGTIAIQGPGSVAVDVTTPTARLGRPLGELSPPKLWSMGYTGPASAQAPDVRIEGSAANAIGIAIDGRRSLEFNGVGIALTQAGAVALSVSGGAGVTGRNAGIAVSGPDSFGMRVRGDARRADAERCPVPSVVKLTDGFIDMTGHNSPAVEIVRGNVFLEDVSIATAAGARFAVGNEGGSLHMEGRRERATIRATGSALAAWTADGLPAASFDFRNVSIRSGSHSLMEAGHDHADDATAQPAHVNLSLERSDARGEIWGGTRAPRVNVTLRDGSTWDGHTNIGGTVTAGPGSTWAVDGNAAVQEVALDRGTIAFRQPESADAQPADFHRLQVRQDMRGNGKIAMRVDAANRDSDKILVGGRVRDDIVIALKDTGTPADTVTSIELLHAARGGPANYALPDKAERVLLAGHAFQLHKEASKDGPAVTVLAVPEGAPFVRGYATLDLPAPRGYRETVAETPAAFYSFHETARVDPEHTRRAPIEAPPSRQGEPDRKPDSPRPDTPRPETIPGPVGGIPGGSPPRPGSIPPTVVPGPDDSPPPGRRPGNDPGGPVLAPVPVDEPAPTPESHPVPVNVPTPTPENHPVPVNEPTPTPESHPVPVNEPTPTPGNPPAPVNEPTPTPESPPAPVNESTPTPGNPPAPVGKPTPAPEGEPPLDGEPAPDAGSPPEPNAHDVPAGTDAESETQAPPGGEGEATEQAEQSQPEPPAAPEPAPPPPPLPTPLSTGATLAMNNAALAAGQGIWNAQLAALNRRLRAARQGNAATLPGGTHAIDGSGIGIWLEATDARQKIDNPLTGKYRQDLQGFVAGIDRAIDVAAGRWHIGLLAAQAGSHRDFDDGKGRTRSAHVGGYATFLGPQGSYATAIVAAGRYRHDMHGKATDGKRLAGAFRNNGIGASIEAGHRVELPRAWFAEPHAGLDYLYVGGARYTLSDGTPVRDHGGHSLQGRVGARIGRVIGTGNGGSVTPYLRAGYAYERGNRNHVTVNGMALKADLGGGRVELGAGFEARLGKAYSLVLDAGYAKGRRFEESRMVIVGLQYRW
ncbi:autotransporter outer membrane beta-barrel domain-containing protein [Bordetella genomosp. 11]|uniref:Autotransporter domain-containing protein n=1 Tax=Bordetella genomosp. 11 TaxID=1416808 RepID=A0A261V1J5_9BORD|nr:autotransporter outer membrane beta-barrel domain-containing protein [Bordetella genomosp. 11]OZI67033.1 hypothetical protein CAL28_04855 [Bordetella genomosp. 11]